MVALVSKIILKIMIMTMVIITMTKVIRSYYDDDENFNNTDDGGNVNNNVIDYYKSYMIIAYHSHLRFYLRVLLINLVQYVIKGRFKIRLPRDNCFSQFTVLSQS